MAQNIKINGVTYNSVNSLQVPKASGGTASFPDTSDATAEAGDIAEGKSAYVDGSKVTGTATGGGVVTGSFTQAETFNIYSKVFSIDTGATDAQQGIVYLRDAANAGTNSYRIIFVVITPDYSYCQRGISIMTGIFTLTNGVISMTETPYAAEFQAGHTYEWVVW